MTRKEDDSEGQNLVERVDQEPTQEVPLRFDVHRLPDAPRHPEERMAVISEVVLPADAGEVYAQAYIDYMRFHHHGLIVLLGKKVSPNQAHAEVTKMVYRENPAGDEAVFEDVEGTCTEVLLEERTRNPHQGIGMLGYGTVASYRSDAQRSFGFPMYRPLSLVGGGEFQPESNDGSHARLVDPTITARPMFAIATPDLGGNPVITGIVLKGE